MRLRIDNEFDRLEAVLVHRPGREIDRLTHVNMRRYLFEDVPYLRRMQGEHDAFVQTLRDHGVEVFYLRDHLLDVLRNERVRTDLLSSVCEVEAVSAIRDELCDLRYWDIDGLVDVLIAGLTADEYRERTGRRLTRQGGEDHLLLPPIPNAYFTRDPAVVVRDAAISSKMHYRERIRETLLTRAVLEHHPSFGDNTITYGGSGEPTEDRPYTIEGGDVIVLSPEAVLVGASERTRSETIEMLSQKCFQFGHTNRLYEIPIPEQRVFMHLDTVFTIIDRGVVLWFSGVMRNVGYVHRYEAVETDDGIAARRVPEERDLPAILRDEFGTDLTIIDTAGGSRHYAAREQRSDATNALAIAPNLVVTYERNERTIAELRSHGVTCITIGDSELVRGLGGPRCMSMPLRRATAPKA